MPQSLPAHNAPTQPSVVLAPTIAPPAVPKKRRHKVIALVAGALCGLCLSLGIAWYVHRFPDTSFPHARQDDYAGLPAPDATLDAAYGDIQQGAPACPDQAVLEQATLNPEESLPASGVLAVEGIPGLVSYRIEERSVAYGTQTLSTRFLFVTNETYRTLCITHRGPDGTELSSIPVLPSLNAGVIWIGTDDPTDDRLLTIETLGDSSGAWPQSLPPELKNRCIEPLLEASREERSVSLSFKESDFAGGFTLAHDEEVLDLTGGEVSDATDEYGKPRRTITYCLSQRDFKRFFPTGNDNPYFSVDVYLSGMRIINEGEVYL